MNLPFKTHDLLTLKGVTHGFFGRCGGVSSGQYNSLNVGRGSDDDPQNVSENRRRVAAALGTSRDNLLSLYQVHSPDVMIVENGWDYDHRPKADGLVTQQVGLAISALAADCGPVLFCDPNARVIGACHAGWRGAVSGVTDSTIDAMESCGATRENIRAVLGPCISAQNYEVGQGFKDTVLEQDAKAESCFHTPNDGVPHFDLKAYILNRLKNAGLQHTSALPDCTYAAADNYFSYRYNTHHKVSDYGRQISAICLTE
ncbi:MAG: peptidoglycan editing factor PgeF [Maricaulaceae bacterium]